MLKAKYRLSKQTKHDVVRLYLENKVEAVNLAEEYGVSVPTIYYWARQYKLKHLDEKEKTREAYEKILALPEGPEFLQRIDDHFHFAEKSFVKRHFSGNIKEQALEMLLSEKVRVEDLVRVLDVNPMTLRAWVRSYKPKSSRPRSAVDVRKTMDFAGEDILTLTRDMLKSPQICGFRRKRLWDMSILHEHMKKVSRKDMAESAVRKLFSEHNQDFFAMKHSFMEMWEHEEVEDFYDSEVEELAFKASECFYSKTQYDTFCYIKDIMGDSSAKTRKHGIEVVFVDIHKIHLKHKASKYYERSLKKGYPLNVISVTNLSDDHVYFKGFSLEQAYPKSDELWQVIKSIHKLHNFAHMMVIMRPECAQYSLKIRIRENFRLCVFYDPFVFEGFDSTYAHNLAELIASKKRVPSKASGALMRQKLRRIRARENILLASRQQKA